MYYGPERPAEGNERWIVAIVAVVMAGLLLAELLRDFHPVKLSVLFMALLLGPMIAVHELGHAIVARWLGWRVCRVVVGSGRRVFAFRWGRTPVDVRLFPLGGYVVPAPERLTSPRLENALIFLAGLGTEVVVALAVVLAVGLDRVVRPSDSVAVIAAQSLAVLVMVDLFFNLLPLPTDGETGVGVTDGLGFVTSPFLPDAYFLSLVTLPWRLEAERPETVEDPDRLVELYEDGVRRHGDNPYMRQLLGFALADAGRRADAAEQLTRALTLEGLADDDAERVKERLDSM